MDEWKVNDNYVYQLQVSGFGAKGRPIIENKFLIAIHGKAPTQEKDELAKKIHSFLQSL